MKVMTMAKVKAAAVGVLVVNTLVACPAWVAAEEPATLPATNPASQPSIHLSPEVQTLIPLIRESEGLYNDIELSYRHSIRNISPTPEQDISIEQTATYTRSGSRWYSDLCESTDPGVSEVRTIASFDGQFHRIFMEKPDEDDRIAIITLGPPPSSIDSTTPFFPFLIDPTRSFVDHFVSGISSQPGDTQQAIRLSDDEYDHRRCARIQVAVTRPAADSKRASQAIYTWYLLVDAHYLPVRMECSLRAEDGTTRPMIMVFEATDVREIAPGIFFPTEVTQTIGDSKAGRIDTWNYDRVVYRPNLPADKLANISIPPGTLLIARRGDKQIARAKTDAYWNLRSAAAFLLDPAATTQPAK